MICIFRYPLFITTNHPGQLVADVVGILMSTYKRSLKLSCEVTPSVASLSLPLILTEDISLLCNVSDFVGLFELLNEVIDYNGVLAEANWRTSSICRGNRVHIQNITRCRSNCSPKPSICTDMPTKCNYSSPDVDSSYTHNFVLCINCSL